MFLPHWGCLGRCGTTPGGRNNLVSELVWHYLVFPPSSLFPVCHLVRRNELAVSGLDIVLFARITSFLMGCYQPPPAYSEANDLLDGCGAIDVGTPRVSGVEY